MLTYKSTATT